MDDPTTGRVHDPSDVQLLAYQRAPLAGEEEDDQPPPTPPPPLPPPSAPIGPPPPRPAEGPKSAPPLDEEAARFVEDCSRPRPMRGTVHLLSSLYARLLLAVVLVLLLTEVLPNGRPLLFFHGYLFSFVLGAGLLCLLCVYVSVVVQRCPGMEELNEMEVSTPAVSKVPRISGFFRVGFFVFGLGSLIGVGLGAATLFSLEQPCMDQINWVQPLLLAAFTLLQTHILCIDSQRSVGYLGWCRHPVLMHLFAANLAIWLRMLIWDGAEIWLRHAHEFIPNPTAHSLDKEGRHTVHVSYDCTWQIQNPDVVEDLLRLRSCHRNSTLGIIWAEARPFVTPFVFQYCIAAAALQYALWKSPPSRSQAPSQQQRMDCRGSSKGLFLGLLVLAVGIVALILYFVLAHNPGLKEETLLVMGSAHAALLLLALLAAMLALCRVGGMCASSDAESGAITLHHILENVGLCALFFQGGCALVAALQDDAALAVLSEGGKAISQSSAVLITLADAALALTHALAQSLLFHRLEQRQCSDGCPHERPGRQVITFLAFCNLVLWVTDTFAGGRDQSSAQLQLKLFGTLPWKLISQLTMPLVMLYRFQSTVYLLEVWHTGYGTDPK
ncbi:proton channel OtopLc [Trichonephila inaurata madagascariensis]|uniref:Proton channel OtopLc n=1 Tax=Trichonephila inaurata madagascariensis TaxID=2747483 RepID=A0A8X6WQ90_9ARAC|nr:proton channel OtopLc [Trichonephila inaurata madagascariensis]